jgi:hypothetical protein
MAHSPDSTADTRMARLLPLAPWLLAVLVIVAAVVLLVVRPVLH